MTAKPTDSSATEPAPPLPDKHKKTGRLTPLGHASEGKYSASLDYAQNMGKTPAPAAAEAHIRKTATTTVAEANAKAAADRAARNHGPASRKKYPFPT